MARKAKKATDTATETTAPVTNATAPASSSMATVDHRALKSALLAMQTVVDRKSSMPMLAHVMMRVSNGMLTVAGTDLNVSLVITIPCESRRNGEACLPGKRLHDIARTYDADTTDIDLEGTKARITNGRAKADLLALPGRDFPKIPDWQSDKLRWGTYKAGELVEMLDSVLFSVCRDETRFYLNGVFCETSGPSLRMVTTDGHRLTKIQRPIAHPATDLATGKIVPCKGATEIARILRTSSDEECSVAFGDTHVFVKSGNAVLISKYIDAQFPPYKQVIPALPARMATVDIETFTVAMKRAKLMCVETRGVKIELEPGKLRIVADDPDTGTVSETLDVDYTGKACAIGFNPQYVLDVLPRLDGTHVVLAISDKLDPALLRSADDAAVNPLDESTMACVIMPMRI